MNADIGLYDPIVSIDNLKKNYPNCKIYKNIDMQPRLIVQYATIFFLRWTLNVVVYHRHTVQILTESEQHVIELSFHRPHRMRQLGRQNRHLQQGLNSAEGGGGSHVYVCSSPGEWTEGKMLMGIGSGMRSAVLQHRRATRRSVYMFIM